MSGPLMARLPERDPGRAGVMTDTSPQAERMLSIVANAIGYAVFSQDGRPVTTSEGGTPTISLSDQETGRCRAAARAALAHLAEGDPPPAGAGFHLLEALVNSPADRLRMIALYNQNAEFHAFMHTLAHLIPSWVVGLATEAEQQQARLDAEVLHRMKSMPGRHPDIDPGSPQDQL